MAGDEAPNTPMLTYAGLTDTGRERKENQDAWRSEVLSDGTVLLLVCDGMGGHEAGGVAARVAADKLVECLRTPTSDPNSALRAALIAANAAVVEATTRHTRNMGTTAIVALIRDGRCWFGWVGDSRLYHIRDGARLAGSVDHTRVQQLVELGLLKPEQALHHPDSHVLLQALGGGPAAQESFKPEVAPEPLLLETGDVILLCSDGLYDMLRDTDIFEMVAGCSPAEAGEKLISAANFRGGHDNITILMGVWNSPLAPHLSEAARARLDAVPAAPTEPPPPISQYDNYGQRRWMMLGVLGGLLVAGLLVWLLGGA